jgi:hypothetical protein
MLWGMSTVELEELRKAGSLARLQGTSLLYNPFLSLDAMPATTGETDREWIDKYQAWKTGWELQDAMLAQRSLDGPAKGRDRSV